MQTFLPYSSFTDSAKVLDRARLGKQRVEAYQILRTLRGETSGWQNHPAVLMWNGYENSLITYGCVMCIEWKSRGYKDSLHSKFLLHSEEYQGLLRPFWMGDQDFHASHRSNLLRKDPQWYGQFGWNEPSDLPYVWPVKKEKIV